MQKCHALPVLEIIESRAGSLTVCLQDEVYSETEENGSSQSPWISCGTPCSGVLEIVKEETDMFMDKKNCKALLNLKRSPLAQETSQQ